VIAGTLLEAENAQPLQGRIEVDDAYWGGERRGGKRGCGAPSKHPFLAAVQTTEEGHPVLLQCSAVDGFRKKTVAQWAAKLLSGSCHVISDGLSAFHGIDDAGIAHTAIGSGGSAASMEVLALQWINLILGNLKDSMHSTYHAIRGKHLPRYLAEFNDRFNRRFNLTKVVDQLIWDVARTPPMPERLVKLAEVGW